MLPGRPHILVVDDDDIVRETMAALIDEAGMNVSCLPSPLGATRVVLEHDVRVVISDVMMPTMNGGAMVDLFRKNPRLAHVAVVLISAMDRDELSQLVQTARPAAFISKDQLFTDFIPLIRRLVVESKQKPPAVKLNKRSSSRLKQFDWMPDSQALRGLVQRFDPSDEKTPAPFTPGGR